MRILSMAALVILGVMFVSCQSIVDDQQPANDGTVTLTASVNLESNSTKALTSAGVKTFAVGDRIAVVYTNNSGYYGETVKATSAALTEGDITDSGKRARFTVSLNNPKEQSVKLVYPAAMVDDEGNEVSISSQDGTLATLASTYDCAVALAYLTIDGSKATITGSSPLANMFTIGRFTIKDSGGEDKTSTITKMTVSDGIYTYTINRAAAAGPIWVAMNPFTNGRTMTVTATDGTNWYWKTTATEQTLAKGKIYPIEVTSCNNFQVKNGTDLVQPTTVSPEGVANYSLSGTKTVSGTGKANITASGTLSLKLTTPGPEGTITGCLDFGNSNNSSLDIGADTDPYKHYYISNPGATALTQTGSSFSIKSKGYIHFDGNVSCSNLHLKDMVKMYVEGDFTGKLALDPDASLMVKGTATISNAGDFYCKSSGGYKEYLYRPALSSLSIGGETVGTIYYQERDMWATAIDYYPENINWTHDNETTAYLGFYLVDENGYRINPYTVIDPSKSYNLADTYNK